MKKLDKGRLVRDQSEGPSKNAKKYIDRAGKQRYTGTRLLKGTQTYPVPFAVWMVRLLPELLGASEGKPVVQSEVPDGPTCFQEMPWDMATGSWSDLADLYPVLVCLRGNVNLQLPEPWRAVFPTRL
ncbi:unnamed protein product [Symbiodinium pilosum]|uniref:Uncharacterized protein n=1 Tax=Symbiodinium pilosum TaxID=2952 RepID=A0A812Y5I9_SYMPI|nr:unnamed protein product [Symbiodinium pilosum]